MTIQKDNLPWSNVVCPSAKWWFSGNLKIEGYDPKILTIFNVRSTHIMTIWRSSYLYILIRAHHVNDHHINCSLTMCSLFSDLWVQVGAGIDAYRSSTWIIMIMMIINIMQHTLWCNIPSVVFHSNELQSPCTPRTLLPSSRLPEWVEDFDQYQC